MQDACTQQKALPTPSQTRAGAVHSRDVPARSDLRGLIMSNTAKAMAAGSAGALALQNSYAGSQQTSICPCRPPVTSRYLG